MKFFAIFAAVLALASANNSWSLRQLSDAIESPYTDPALKPFLVTALNEMMNALWSGQQMESMVITIPSLDFGQWTPTELSNALQNPATDPTLIPVLEEALDNVMAELISGNQEVVAAFATHPLELHYYTLNDLSEALQNPDTNPALVPYLEQALEVIMDALFAGKQMEAITIAVPAGLVPVEIPVEVPAEVIPSPVVVPENPVSSSSSPLVQIIINIKQQEVAPVVVPEIIADAEHSPEPINIVDNAPMPIQIVDSAPEPIQIVDAAPEPIQIVDAAPEPIQIVDAAPQPIQIVDAAVPIAHPAIIKV